MASSESVESRDCTRLLAFYEGTGADHRGRRIGDILQFSLAELEEVHDYIQWLFPLNEPSAVMPKAPLVDAECIRAFTDDAKLTDTMRLSFETMLAFYGLKLDQTAAELVISKSADFVPRAENWLRLGDHNFLRLTRIMRSMSLLGQRPLALALLACLERIYDEGGSAVISASTLGYWRRAVDP
jgi:hypothetical protein